MPDPGSAMAFNRYMYVSGNPLVYTDPSGHCPMCISAAVGGLVGGAISYGSQVAANVSENGLTTDAFKDVNWKSVGKAAVVGAVGGATFGMGLAAGGAVAAAVGISSASGTAASIAGAATIAVSGAAAGQTSRAANNILNHRSVTKGLGNPKDIAIDATLSLVSVRALRGKYRNTLYSDVAKPGSFAQKSLPGKWRYANKDERKLIRRYLQEEGCHHCGTKVSAKPIADHMPPRSRATSNTQFQYYPQCKICMILQRKYLRWHRISPYVPQSRHWSAWRPYQTWGPTWRLWE